MDKLILKERQTQRQRGPEEDEYIENNNKNPLFETKIEAATEGLLPCFSNTLYHKLPPENALTIAGYIISMKTEINASLNYRKDSIRVLYHLSRYCRHKPFRSDDISDDKDRSGR